MARRYSFMQHFLPALFQGLGAGGMQYAQALSKQAEEERAAKRREAEEQANYMRQINLAGVTSRLQSEQRKGELALESGLQQGRQAAGQLSELEIQKQLMRLEGEIKKGLLEAEVQAKAQASPQISPEAILLSIQDEKKDVERNIFNYLNIGETPPPLLVWQRQLLQKALAHTWAGNLEGALVAFRELQQGPVITSQGNIVGGLETRLPQQQPALLPADVQAGQQGMYTPAQVPEITRGMDFGLPTKPTAADTLTAPALAGGRFQSIPMPDTGMGIGIEAAPPRRSDPYTLDDTPDSYAIKLRTAGYSREEAKRMVQMHFPQLPP